MKTKLNLLQGTAFAIGSIIGSGILFLPSLTYSLSQNDILIVWGLTSFICIPIFLIFSDLLDASVENNGIQGIVTLGLGQKVGRIIPILILSTVSIGMPCSAIIVADFVSEYFDFKWLTIIISFGIMLFGIISNYKGLKFSANTQSLIIWGLIFVSILILVFSTPKAVSGYGSLVPSIKISGIFQGIVVAFWAFAGLENLTFMAKDFKNPQKDFFLSSFIALGICGFLYLALSANYAAIIPINEVKPTMGLFQLAQQIEPQNIFLILITSFSLICVISNFNSWILGLSNMIQNASYNNLLPKILSRKGIGGVNKNAIFCLGLLFTISLIVLNFNRNFIEPALILVSVNFIVIYILAILSYLIQIKSIFKKATSFTLIAFLTFTILSFSYYVLYPIVVILIGTIIYEIKKAENKVQNGNMG